MCKNARIPSRTRRSHFFYVGRNCKCQRKAKQDNKTGQNLNRKRRKAEMTSARRRRLTGFKDKRPERNS